MLIKPNHFRSECALATALDIVGDKWSLLIVRDIYMKKHRYCDFQNSPEGIPTNILASRLRFLEEKGILEKQPYQLKPLRYEYFLTPKGADLLPVIQQFAQWATKYFAECSAPPEEFLATRPEQFIKPKN